MTSMQHDSDQMKKGLNSWHGWELRPFLFLRIALYAIVNSA